MHPDLDLDLDVDVDARGSSEHLAWLKQRLGACAEEVAVEGNRPLVLDDPRYAYVTLSEHHQLFCVASREGRPQGRREHLALCPPGQLVFGVAPRGGPEPAVLLLSGASGSVVWRVAVAHLCAPAAGPAPAGAALGAHLS